KDKGLPVRVGLEDLLRKNLGKPIERPKERGVSLNGLQMLQTGILARGCRATGGIVRSGDLNNGRLASTPGMISAHGDEPTERRWVRSVSHQHPCGAEPDSIRRQEQRHVSL